jgi:hypothetical protein
MNVAEYLASLGFRDGEHVGLFWKTNGDISSAVIQSEWASVYFDHRIPTAADAYLAPNPVTGPARENSGRGKVEDVHTVRALYVDIDVKPGACRDINQAHQLVDDISSLLSERPTVLIHSGGGLQPIWNLEDTDPIEGAKILRRFGRLARVCADARGIAIDSVFDLARVLRAPGTLNHKYDPPVEAACVPDSGGPMTAEYVRERLDEAGILDIADDVGLGADVIKHPEDCAWSPQPCNYIKTLIAAWNEEPVTARHPWLLCQFVRLECARRYGCLTHAAYRAAVHVLEARMHHLCTRVGEERKVGTHEIRDISIEAINRASRKTNAQVARELGSHRHNTLSDKPSTNGHVAPLPDDQAPQITLEDIEQDFWEARPELSLIRCAALSQMASPWAVLASVAAIALSSIPPVITLPPVIGGKGSLNWFAALAANSAGGKGAAWAVAQELYPVHVNVRNIGSGEGMIEAYQRGGKTDDSENEIVSILFSVSEIDALGAMKSRSGQTTMAILRQGFSGESLGFTYRGRHDVVAAHTYRMTMLTSVQPATAGTLLDDAAGGTPQRFMWFPAKDRRCTLDNTGKWPLNRLGERKKVPYISGVDISRAPLEVPIPDSAVRLIRETRAAFMTDSDNALDGHSLYSREKLAYALGVLHGELEITEESWRLSGIAAAVSDWYRGKVIKAYQYEKDRVSKERGRSRAVENYEQGLAGHDIHAEHNMRIKSWILRTLEKHGSATRGALTKKCAYRDRAKLDEVLALAEGMGQVVLSGDIVELAL